MSWLYLIIPVVAGTILWPIGRWAMRDEGSPITLGFWISLTSALIGMATVIARHQNFWVWQVWAAGILFGIAYSVGFCMLIMSCLKIGPAGPTVTVNNMAMVCGVLYSLLWLNPHRPDWRVTVGIMGVCLALLLLNLGKKHDSGAHGITSKWLGLVLAGGVFSGLSFMTQAYMGVRQPMNGSLFINVGFATSTLVLVITTLFVRDGFRRRRERTGGICIGACNGLSLPLTILAMRHFGAEVVLPVTVATPMVIMLLAGRFVYRESLSRPGWIGCLISIPSVVLLSL